MFQGLHIVAGVAYYGDMTTTGTAKYPYYSIVSAGRTFGPAPKTYYRSLASAMRDAAAMTERGGNVDVRIVGCQTRDEATSADIGDSHPVVRCV